MTTEMVVAKQRIYHDAEHPSAIVLPVIPSAPEEDKAYEVFTRDQ